MAVTLAPKGTRGTGIPGFAKTLMKAGSGLGNLLFNTLGDRMKMQGQPLVLLTTMGAKSGKERKALLGRFDDTEHPGAWLVVGSNGGAARHPGWCHNLVANPDRAWATVDKQETRVRADSLEGEEYQEAWDRIVSLAPGYGSYLEKTDRKIPIIRLTPVEDQPGQV
jgi:deazaflavin-dependent oxidoreductase (nitroreductase family)